MKITIWGTRGSIPSPSPENNLYGGNTSCVQVTTDDAFIVLDAGSGIRRLGYNIPSHVTRIDILLTHLHMDHIMGLGFFSALYNPNLTVNIWGPTSSGESLHNRLMRYLSPPLFPIRLHDLPCHPILHEINHGEFNIGSVNIKSAYVCHPGPTLGFRLETKDAVLSYIPDHEPALGASNYPHEPEWTSGYDLAHNADLLFHDAQYTSEEYNPRVGWGHSSIGDALKFGELTKVKKMLFFHHDPSHSDKHLEHLLAQGLDGKSFSFEAGIAAEGEVIDLTV